MFGLNLKKGKYPIIIKPNLGQPVLLNLRDFKDSSGKIQKRVYFEALLIALPSQDIKDLFRYFHRNIFIQPILKKSGKFSDRRGKLIPIEISEINEVPESDFRDLPVLERDECIAWDIYNNLLEIENIFGKREVLFEAVFEIREIRKIERLFEDDSKDFILFDIVHDLPNRTENKVNFHSLAIYNKEWNDFRFIHASDFHIARRNDFISKFLKDKAKDEIRRRQAKGKDVSKVNTFILRRDFEFKEEFQEKKQNQLREARYNFNYSLRKLIEFVNECVETNQLDFILMTGDLIDYLQIARGNYQYKNNYEVFVSILLGINKGLDLPPYLSQEEYLNKEEILAPVFTLVGNHDYRHGHYSILVGKTKKVFGMTRKDVKGYYDQKFFNYLDALNSQDKYLRDYFRYINPNLNFHLQVGEHYNFIFLDTGQDSIADMHDLLKGGPSTKGLKDYQIDLLRAYIRLSHDENVIVVMHTPPVAPSLGRIKRWRLKRKFKLKRKFRWSDLYEHNLKNYVGSGRLEKLLNLKYQTIMYNWATFLKICVGSDKIIRRKVDLILCGHAHTLREFRLKEAKEKENINLGFYLFPIIINVPCEVYTNNYRAIFKSFRDPQELQIWDDVNKPFIFQTQAIGPVALHYKFAPPGFRCITIKEDEIMSVGIFSLHLVEKELNLEEVMD